MAGPKYLSDLKSLKTPLRPKSVLQSSKTGAPIRLKSILDSPQVQRVRSMLDTTRLPSTIRRQTAPTIRALERGERPNETTAHVFDAVRTLLAEKFKSNPPIVPQTARKRTPPRPNMFPPSLDIRKLALLRENLENHRIPWGDEKTAAIPEALGERNQDLPECHSRKSPATCRTNNHEASHGFLGSVVDPSPRSASHPSGDRTLPRRAS